MMNKSAENCDIRVMGNLVHYGGNGYVFNEVGLFVVKAEGLPDKSFTHQSVARDYFDSLNVGKAIWDQTGHRLELMDAYIWEPEEKVILGTSDMPF